MISKNSISMRCSARLQKGFSLIEALVAFLMLSIGMLGIGSLQLVSLKAARLAGSHMIAVIKVEEMFERIRNNSTAVLSYNGAVPVNNSCNDYVVFNTCTSAEMVTHDVYEWENELAASMVGVTGLVTSITVTAPVVDTQPLAVVLLTVSWDERLRDSQAQESLSYTASADICVSTAC